MNDTDPTQYAPAETEQPVMDFGRINDVMRAHGIDTLDEGNLRRIYEKSGADGLKRVVVWHMKEENIADVDAVGAECFDDWEEGVWV